VDEHLELDSNLCSDIHELPTGKAKCVFKDKIFEVLPVLLTTFGFSCKNFSKAYTGQGLLCYLLNCVVYKFNDTCAWTPNSVVYTS